MSGATLVITIFRYFVYGVYQDGDRLLRLLEKGTGNIVNPPSQSSRTTQCTALCTQYTIQSTQNTIPVAVFSRSGACPSKRAFGQPEQFPWPSVTETSLLCYWPVGINANSLVETTHRGTHLKFKT